MEIGGTLLIPDIRANIVDKSLTCVPLDTRGSCRIFVADAAEAKLY